MMVYGFDLHNTIVNSDNAWKKAFQKMLPDKQCYKALDMLDNGVSRHKICEKYNISYDSLEEEYRNNLECNYYIIEWIRMIKRESKVILISNARKERIMKDLEKFKITLLFDQIYSGDDGKKNNCQYLEKIMNDNNIERMIYIGNDEVEDKLNNNRILSMKLLK